ncbi:hypothetical protein BDU57DRAFT_528427 [Ampelomyces quisqualis]|uniref:t-SNARE coiled-coil homology domain-containing protein n=1 Tax=Ampelomyces quisqualis TaxID=50730 RepID=A0A6A5QSU7_AMPQU|nr:hypothetical protein BDU57DRAFT_528427 [Ampelomyces quisqualis]
MSSRFGRSDARDDLFSSYNRSASPSKSKTKPTSPYGGGAAGYGYSAPASEASFSAYPGAPSNPSSSSNGNLYPSRGGGGGGYSVRSGMNSSGETFRSATPNSRGQYSAAVLDELESQNDNEYVGVLTNKVLQLKNSYTSPFIIPCPRIILPNAPQSQLTHLIGDEIRDSTSLAEKMNDQFETSRTRLRGTMNRMLSMARKTGVGWKVWVGFFAAVILLFWWVW